MTRVVGFGLRVGVGEEAVHGQQRCSAERLRSDGESGCDHGRVSRLPEQTRCQASFASGQSSSGLGLCPGVFE